MILEAIQFASCRVRCCFFQSYNGTMMGDGCNVPHYVPDVFLMSIILFMGTFLLSIELKDFKNALFFPSKVETYALILKEKRKYQLYFFFGDRDRRNYEISSIFRSCKIVTSNEEM